MVITNDIRYVGVNDHKVDLFEGQYVVPHGMSYNSYVILDEKIAVMDTADVKFTEEWLANIAEAAGDKTPDYLVVHHMEPDHSASISAFKEKYPSAAVVASAKAFTMMKNFYGDDFSDNRVVVKEGDVLDLGAHKLTFVAAPMVHWPEVMVSYDSTDKVLFSADGFGKFGANDQPDEIWDDEARRYYIGIVGKYGAQVQALLKKAAGLDISIICPLHGPVLKEDLGHYIGLYDIWSSYKTEKEGVFIAYASIYGHTKEAAELLASKIQEKGCEVKIMDLARCDMAEAVAQAFAYGKIVLASVTYNADVFPYMKDFINHLAERNFQNKTVAFMESGSWAISAAKVMGKMLESCKNLTVLENKVTVMSALSDDSRAQIEALAAELL